ncbi:PAN domain-containing protein [Bradyrhizobium sp. LTSP885]|uniref:PAN domain-containing protein n=1 Tax=Bradyrhizobium sp. LTSP885 TaxID=1619232 RepID=UPI0009E1CC9E|nr:PAN domain-containing protein [Bradyrhizobium sp. LTSP885]
MAELVFVHLAYCFQDLGEEKVLVRALITGVLLSLPLPHRDDLHTVNDTVIGGDGGRGGDAVINVYGGTVVILSPLGGSGGPGGSAAGPGATPTSSTAPIVAPKDLPISSTFATRDNRDIEGSDIQFSGGSLGVPGVDLGGCAKICGGLPSCVAFSFDRWNNRCFPKDKITGSLLDVRSMIAVKRPAELPTVSKNEAKMQPVRGKRFHGTVLSEIDASTSDLCQSKCSTDLHCVGFTFNKVGASSSCTSFKMIDGWDLDSVSISGHKWQSPN